MQKPVATETLAPVGQSGVTLPKTATDAELRLWFGLLLCLASLILLVIGRRRRRPMKTRFHSEQGRGSPSPPDTRDPSQRAADGSAPAVPLIGQRRPLIPGQGRA